MARNEVLVMFSLVYDHLNRMVDVFFIVENGPFIWPEAARFFTVVQTGRFKQV